MHSVFESVEVAAAVIEKNGKILISRRSKSAHQGGKWEFPGGKIELGESATQALHRELQEELGISVTRCRSLIRIPHRYIDKSVVLHVFKVTAFEGEPHGKEGQPIRWVEPENLSKLNFPDANYPIIQAAQLPEICVITPPQFSARTLFVESLKRTMRQRQLMVLRLPQLDGAGYRTMAEQAVSISCESGCRLLLTSSAEEIQDLGAGGLHLNSLRLMALTKRPLPGNFLVSAACHSREELVQAQKLDLDFVLLSPVKLTLTHPEAKAIGWPQFSRLVHDCRLPVYALGGMSSEDLSEAFDGGAQGIAGISAIWG